MQKNNFNDLNFPWKKLFRNFGMIYNFTIAIARIHFAIQFGL